MWNNSLFLILYHMIDRGNQLTYPVRYNEMSPHMSGKEDRHEHIEPEAQALTGVAINNHFV